MAASNEGANEELLSVAEAALRYGLPAWKVSRLIRENQLEGARKVRGEHGPVWRIPAAALEAKGFTRQLPTAGETVTLALAELRRTLQSLTGTLRIERQRLANKEHELQDAMLQIGQLRRDLKYERTRREDAEAQLDRLRGAAIDLVVEEQGKDPSERVIDLIGVDRFALEAERRRRKSGG
jgi:hypothetical protein